MPEYNLVVVGGGAVGKSALTIQFTQKQFVETYDPTIEDRYAIIKELDGEKCALDIQDTAGQEEFSALRDPYMRSGSGFLLVYSVTERTSLNDIPPLLEQIKRVKDTDTVPAILIGNKADLEQERQVSWEDGEAKAKQWGCLFLETSAKTGMNVDEAFTKLVREVERTRPAPVERKKSFCMVL
eukprot:gb/GECH01011970.1/.p1 GENE.gb/GECH01011970.1/~~gb/GECH01011970.1/.p1  ORF type:complete len:183 (+),score=33.61 gb/GECH01011970.1/:1-549(+)